MTLPALLLDHGNTRLKWCVDHDGLTDHGVISATDPAGFRAVLTQTWSTLPRVGSVWLASVGDAGLRAVITELCTSLWGIAAREITVTARAAGVSCGYRVPAQLGVDRWAAVVAAYHRSGGAPCGVIDCGSAVTIDAVNELGRHQGGVIFPGAQAMRSAFARSTAVGCSLSGVEDFKITVFATDSPVAVASGARFAMLGGIERCARDMETALGMPLRWYLCGGDAGTVAMETNLPVEQVPYLVLEGVSLLRTGVAPRERSHR